MFSFHHTGHHSCGRTVPPRSRPGLHKQGNFQFWNILTRSLLQASGISRSEPHQHACRRCTTASSSSRLSGLNDSTAKMIYILFR